MLKKIFPIGLLLFISVLTFAQKSEIDLAYDEACKCIVDLDKKNLKPEDKKAQGMECMQNTMMKHISALAKDNGYDISKIDSEAARLIGEKFGQALVNKCPGSISLMIEMSKGELEKRGGVPLTAQYTSSGTTTGVFLRLDLSGDSPKVVLKSDSVTEESFLWMRPFSGSDNFQANYKTLLNKKVTLEWGEFRKYVASTKSYIKVREIISLY